MLDVRFVGMRNGIPFTVAASDRHRLDAIISAPSSPQRHVWRARIVVLRTDGAGTGAIMASSGKSKTCVWRWQARFMSEGVGWAAARDDASDRHPEDGGGERGGSLTMQPGLP